MKDLEMKTALMKKKISIKFYAVCILLVMLFNLAGCGSNNNPSSSTDPSSSTETFSAKDAIKIKDIDWDVTESVLDGERIISFNYTNNSQYTIIDFVMEFVQKEGTTEEQLTVFDKLKEEREWTDEEVKEIYIEGYNHKFADPGETVTDSPCVINGTYTLVENMEQFEIMEPSMATIGFIGPDGKGYVIYYDYKTQSYGESSQGGLELQQWSDSEISSLLPKAEFKAVTVSTDDEDRFFFYAYGVSREEFEAYVESVKSKGFTDVGFEGNNSYRATNADGIEANITYNAVEETMTGCVEQ